MGLARMLARCVLIFLMAMTVPFDALAASFDFKSLCLTRGLQLPVPWKIRDQAPQPDFFYNSPHFTAPFRDIGIVISDPRPNSKNAYVALRKCLSPNDPAYGILPCGELDAVKDATKRGAGFTTVLKTVGDLNVGYRRFWPSDRSYVGICDGLNFETLATERWSICRVWMPDPTNTRGLYVIVPGEVFPSIPKIMESARLLLNNKFAQCAI